MNVIKFLETSYCRLTNEPVEMEAIASDFFKELFTFMWGVRVYQLILLGVERSITEYANKELTKPFVKEEIFYALKGMGSTEALRAYGFSVLFFQQFWYIVGEEVSNFCLGLLNNQGNLEQVNSITIVLIPKVLNPTNIAKVRLISLCNVSIKLCMYLNIALMILKVLLFWDV